MKINKSLLKWASLGATILFAFCYMAFRSWIFFIGPQNIHPKPDMDIWIVAGIFISIVGPITLFLYYQIKMNAMDTQTLLSLNFGDWKNMDPGLFPKENEMEITVPFDRAFQISQLAIQLLPSVNIIDSDPGTGMIKAESESSWGSDSMIMLTIEKSGENATRIHIGSYYPRPVYAKRRGPLDSGQNKKNIMIISNYLREQARQTAPSDSMRTQSFQEYSDSSSAGLPASINVSPETNPFYKNPQKAAILSLILPGLGQSYNGRSDEGIEIAFCTGTCLMLFVVPGMLIWIYGIYYAYATARDMNSQIIPYRHISVPGMILTGCFSIVCLGVAYYIIGIYGLPGLFKLAWNIFLLI